MNKTVIGFKSPSCGPCRRLSPILDELAQRYEGKIELITVDIVKDSGRAQQLTEKYHVMSVPTLIALHDEQVIDQQVGFSGRDAVETLFEKLSVS